VKPSGRQTAVALAAAAVVAGLIYLTRPSPPAGEAPESHQPIKASDRVRARLDQLRADYPNWSGRSGALQARSQVAATPGADHVGREPKVGTSHETTDSGATADESPLYGVDTDDIPAMTRIALGDQDPDRRSTAVTVLGGSDDPAAIPVLEQALSDNDEDVRMAALQALSDFTDEPPVEAIESALNDAAPDIRFEALSILADIGGERARDAVEKALNDPDEDVRDLAEGIMDLEATYEDETGPDQGQPSGRSGTK
jgi:HEAT repeat protein